ncbi:MAG: transglutaminase-like domain-containing protein [Candidatus Poribacteria bacterium]|nr:transglutaminase-like domain-containing protein [Candidatus Poribacteria bacterium]MDE0503739.1 transglutaminase-like domain-containing protein [Candidatus Poribacteria bacterium]
MKHIEFTVMFLLGILQCSSLGGAVTVDPAEVERMFRLPQDDWLTLELMGTKAGYAHIVMDNAVYGGEDVLRTRIDMVIEVKRGDWGLRFENTRISYVGMDLVPRRFVLTSNETGAEKRVEGRIEDGIAYIDTTLAGKTSHSRKSIPPHAIFEQTIPYHLLKEGMATGNEYQLQVFNLDLLQSVDTKVKVIREDILDYEGDSIPVYMVEYTMDIMGGLRTVAWITSEGRTYRTEVPLMGFPLVLTKTDMQTALGDSGHVDVILNTKIYAQGKQPTTNSPRLRAALRLEKGILKDAVMTNRRQTIIIADDSPNMGVLKIDVPSIDVSKAPSLPLSLEESGNELVQFLKPSVYIQADHAAIRMKAVDILGGETNAWKAATKLCHWVFENVSDKNYQTGFGSSLQTLNSLEGDCTEHTVLFIALARSIGIPSRICAGIVFQRDAFYYHFWPEIYAGEWIAMEPTLGQLQADANHIQLAGSTLESDSMLEYGEGVLRTLNQLEIEVIE